MFMILPSIVLCIIRPSRFRRFRVYFPTIDIILWIVMTLVGEMLGYTCDVIQDNAELHDISVQYHL